MGWDVIIPSHAEPWCALAKTRSNDFTPIQIAVLDYLKSVTTSAGCSETIIAEEFSLTQVK